MTQSLTASFFREITRTMSEPLANKVCSDVQGLAWALSRLALEKDAPAWSLLLAQAGPDIQRVAMRLTGDFALAEDAVQETLMLVRDHAANFAIRSNDADDDARRWILGVAANASLHLVRRHHRQAARDHRAGHAAALVATPVADPSQRAENADESFLLRRELAELPTAYGQALALHYFGDQDYPALATHLRVSVNTVRIRVHRGLKALRERLDRCGVALSLAALTGLLSHLGAATTVGGAVTVSASTLGLISSTAVPTVSFSAASGGMTMATVLASAFAALFAVVIFSGAWLNSFSIEPTRPQLVGAVGAGEVVNKAQARPFILVVKTDQMVEVKTDQMVEENPPFANNRAARDIPVAGPFFTSGPNQFRLPLQPFARYDFTIDWGDGTKEVVRSNGPAGKAIVDEAWLAQVKKGLDQPVTVDFENIPYDFVGLGRNFAGLGSSGDIHCLSYLLEKAGIDLCANVIEVPGLQTDDDKTKLPSRVPLKVEAMKLRDVFALLTKLTGLTYVLHDRALLFVAERKDIPSLVCPQHTYAKAGTYTIKITENVIGGFPQVYFNSGYDGVKVIDLAQWGSNTWMSLDEAFMGCVNMTISASDAATAGTGAVENFYRAWCDCRGLTSFPLLNTAAGTNFGEAWSGCSGLTSFPLLNTAAGTSFSFTWSYCSGLTSFPLLNISAVRQLHYTWSYCSGLTSFPLLNTAAVTDFTHTWRDCSSLMSFPLLDTAAVTDFIAVWSGCSSLTSFPLLNTSAGTGFNGAWSDCSGLTSFPLLNTSAGTDFSVAWSGCSGLTSFPLLNVYRGTDFSRTWSGCSGLTSFPLLNIYVGTDFSGAWSGCSGLTSFPLLSTPVGTDFSQAWSGCSGLTSFPLLNTSAGTSFNGAWDGCSGLKSFPLLSTAAGTDFDSAWSECSGLTSFPWLDTSGGKNFDHAWSGCRGLTSFPLLNFRNMEQAEGCFAKITLTSASYGELLVNIAALNKTGGGVTFDGGTSKTSDQNGIQAREKLIKEQGWTIFDGDHLEPAPQDEVPEELQPQPEAVNEF